MLRFFDGRAFLVGMAVGLGIGYMMPPLSTKVTLHPTPDNAGDVLFRDRAGVCFGFSPKEVSCPSDSTSVHRIQAQQ